MINNLFDIENLQCEYFVYSFQNVNDFRSSFRSKFKYIIAYHGTNLTTEELESINNNGLRISTRDLIEKKAKHRFFKRNCNKHNNEIENYISQYFNENELHTKDEINFGLIKSDIIQNYHYLLFGAESLLPLADFLRNKFHRPFRKILVETGSHYIIKVKIPIEKTDDKWIDLIYYYFHESDFPISLVHNYNLSAKNILKIEEVERPKDTQNLIWGQSTKRRK